MSSKGAHVTLVEAASAGSLAVTSAVPSESTFLLEQLILRDFKVRYRNMSLGMLWSILNPLVMVGVYTFIFSNVFRNYSIAHYPLFVLCGVVCYNYVTLAWLQGTYSITGNASLVKRVKFRREIIPIASVLSNGIHFLVQFSLVLIFTIWAGLAITASWLWMPLIIAILVFSASGLALLFSAIDVYLRDVRYVVESACMVIFWLTPVFYSDTMVPARYRTAYLLNPISSAVICLRQIVLEHRTPDFQPFAFGLLTSTGLFLAGYLVFDELKSKFSDHI